MKFSQLLENQELESLNDELATQMAKVRNEFLEKLRDKMRTIKGIDKVMIRDVLQPNEEDHLPYDSIHRTLRIQIASIKFEYHGVKGILFCDHNNVVGGRVDWIIGLSEKHDPSYAEEDDWIDFGRNISDKFSNIEPALTRLIKSISKDD